MKLIIVSLIMLLTQSAFAEHDATYCGKFIEGTRGVYAYGLDRHPELVIAVEYRIKNGRPESWDPSFAGVVGLNDKQLRFVKSAIQSSKKKGTFFCVKARWGGAAYSSSYIDHISLTTDAVIRVDYMSNFAKKTSW